MVAPPSEAAKVVSAPGANCGLYTITVNTGLEENVYKPYEKFYYVVDLQKWNGAEWKNVDRFPKQGWGVGNVSDDPSISTAYLHGHYRVEASFIWFDQNSGRYKSWTSTNGYKVDIAHFGLRKGERGNHYCTY